MFYYKNIIIIYTQVWIVIRLITILLVFVCVNTQAQVKNLFKFSTFYIAANGGTSLSDKDVFSVSGQLSKIL